MFNYFSFDFEIFYQSHYNKTILNNNNNKIENKINSNEYLWLLFFDLIFYSFLAYLTYNYSQKIKENKDDQQNYILKSIQWLFNSILMRTVSLILIILIKNPVINSPLKWFNIILHFFPSFIFIIPYYYLSIFLSEIYYIKLEYNNNFIKPILLCIIIIEFICLFFISLITLFAGTYEVFYYITELLNGLLYFIISLIIFFYGRKVSKYFYLKNITFFNYNSNEISKKLYIISNSFGGLFLLKGIFSIYIIFKKINIKNLKNVFDFFYFIIFEIIPILIYIINGNINFSNEFSQRNSSTYEMEYSNSFQLRQTLYKPPIFQ